MTEIKSTKEITYRLISKNIHTICTAEGPVRLRERYDKGVLTYENPIVDILDVQLGLYVIRAYTTKGIVEGQISSISPPTFSVEVKHPIFDDLKKLGQTLVEIK